MESQGNNKLGQKGAAGGAEGPQRQGEGQELRFVVLRHEREGERVHFDLILETDSGAERLPTFRVMEEPEGWAGSEIEVVRNFDHRRIYLSFEGELTEGRGRVKRVAEGTLKEVVCDLSAISAVMDWEQSGKSRRLRLEARRIQGDLYRLKFECV